MRKVRDAEGHSISKRASVNTKMKGMEQQKKKESSGCVKDSRWSVVSSAV